MLDPKPHFLRGLVGESDRQNSLGGHIDRANQPGDSVDQDPSLAASGSGKHQNRRSFRADRLALRFI